MSLANWRDVIIIAAGSLTILVLLAIFVFTVVIGFATKALIGAVRSLLRDEVSPLLQQARHTVKRLQGTVTFVSENAVGPVIRVYGIFAGTRRLFGVLSGVSSRGKKRS